VPQVCPPRPPATVLDTNVVLDWLVFRDPGIVAIAAAVADGRLRWLATARMRAELAAVLARATLSRWTSDTAAALAGFDRHAAIRPPPPPAPLLCTDPDDQDFVDLALAERADWLVTRDHALLALARRARPLGVKVVRPAHWRPAADRQSPPPTV